MKKKIFAVCFCLFAAASISMAADPPLFQGTYDDYGKWEGDYFDYNGVDWELTGTYMWDPFEVTPESWNPAGIWDELWEGLEPLPIWNYLVLVNPNYSWYLFAADTDGLLSSGFSGVFDHMYLYYGTGGNPPAVPEPGTLLLLGSGIAGLGLTLRRRLNK